MASHKALAIWAAVLLISGALWLIFGFLDEWMSLPFIYVAAAVGGVAMLIGAIYLLYTLGGPELGGERLLLRLIAKNKIKGHFDDMGTGTQGFHCPHCGTTMTFTPVKVTSVKCKSCGELLVVT
jgi:ribosomal protein S27E